MVGIATLQSIGMTNKNVKNMLVWEGLIHAGIVMAVVLTIGQLFIYKFAEFIAGTSWFFNYDFQLTPLLVCIPVLILICYLVPTLAFRHIGRKSIAERLRLAE